MENPLQHPDERDFFGPIRLEPVTPPASKPADRVQHLAGDLLNICTENRRLTDLANHLRDMLKAYGTHAPTCPQLGLSPGQLAPSACDCGWKPLLDWLQ
jgi:hypothetical protein